jgi:hypothetical protein
MPNWDNVNTEDITLASDATPMERVIHILKLFVRIVARTRRGCEWKMQSGIAPDWVINQKDEHVLQRGLYILRMTLLNEGKTMQQRYLNIFFLKN